MPVPHISHRKMLWMGRLTYVSESADRGGRITF